MYRCNLRFVFFCGFVGMILLTDVGHGQDDLEFKRELFRRAELHSTDLDQEDWLLASRDAAIALSTQQAPSAERLAELDTAEYDHEMEKSRAVSEYLSECAQSGAIKNSLKKLRTMKATDEVLRAGQDMAVCCGFFGDGESFEELCDFVRSRKGKPLMAYALETEESSEGDEDRIRVVAQLLTPDMTAGLLAKLQCLYCLGQAQAGKLPDDWKNVVPDQGYRDLILLQQAIERADQWKFENAITISNTITAQAVSVRAYAEIWKRLFEAEIPETQQIALAKRLMSRYHEDDSTDSSNNLQSSDSPRNPILRLAGTQQYDSIEKYVEEMLDYDFEFSVSRSEIVGFLSQIPGGVKLLAELPDEANRLESLILLYEHASDENDFLLLEKIADRVPPEEFGKLSADGISGHNFRLSKAASYAKKFPEAERLVQEIQDDLLRKRARLYLAVFRLNEEDLDLLVNTASSKRFLREVESAPTDRVERMKWIVDYTMKIGWFERRTRNSNDRLLDDDSLIFSKNLILEEFEKVANVSGTAKSVRQCLNSFTRPSKEAVLVLQDMFELCGETATEEYQWRSRLRKLSERLIRLNRNRLVSSLEKTKAGELIFVELQELITSDKGKFLTYSILDEFAIEFAKLGNKLAVEDLVKRIVDISDRAITLVECSLVFPPKTRTLRGISRFPNRDGGIF